MIKKLDQNLADNINAWNMSQNFMVADKAIKKINEIVDAVNNQQIQLNNHKCRLLDLQNQITEHDQEIDDCAATISKMGNVEPAENVQPDYVTTSYMTNGHTKEYYGQKGASIVTDYPLPAGYVITIREPETKGDDDE